MCLQFGTDWYLVHISLIEIKMNDLIFCDQTGVYKKGNIQAQLQEEIHVFRDGADF